MITNKKKRCVFCEIPLTTFDSGACIPFLPQRAQRATEEKREKILKKKVINVPEVVGN